MHKNLAGFTTMVFPAEAAVRDQRVLDGRVGHRHEHRHRDGPDRDGQEHRARTWRKIVDTLRHFGPGFDYVVTAYPPFLKHLRDQLDAEGLPLGGRTGSAALVGGEGMTEALRDYLEERFLKVRSGYGASDLTIGMAGETDFSVWVRRRLRTDAAAARPPCSAPTSTGCRWSSSTTRWRRTWRPPPTTSCSARSTRRRCSTPKLRYNIGDEGRLSSFPEVLAAIADPAARAEADAAWQVDRMRLPLLFLYGRQDSTISYMGANIYPQDVEYGLYAGNPLAHLLAELLPRACRAGRPGEPPGRQPAAPRGRDASTPAATPHRHLPRGSAAPPRRGQPGLRRVPRRGPVRRGPAGAGPRATAPARSPTRPRRSRTSTW